LRPVGDSATPLPLPLVRRYFGNVCELDIIFNFHKVCDLAVT